MEIQEKRVVTLSYVVQENNAEGAIIETMDVNYPFKFMFGTGELLPGFEEELQGRKEGESFAFTLPAEKAYGPVREENIIDVPIDVFKVGGILQEELLEKGKFVSLTDDRGQSHNGKVLDWTEEQVTIDFNHAMAGKDLYFRGVILDVREATAEEQARNNYVEDDGVRRNT